MSTTQHAPATDDDPVFFNQKTPPRPEVAHIRFGTDELGIIDREAERFNVTRAEFIRVAVGRFVASIPDAE